MRKGVVDEKPAENDPLTDLEVFSPLYIRPSLARKIALALFHRVLL